MHTTVYIWDLSLNLDRRILIIVIAIYAIASHFAANIRIPTPERLDIQRTLIDVKVRWAIRGGSLIDKTASCV